MTLLNRPENQRSSLDRLKDKPSRFMSRVKADARFIKNLLDAPKKTGAIAPSSAMLSRRMVQFVPQDTDLPVLEIGPGTGSVTKALLNASVTPERLYALEHSDDFCKVLAKRFPKISILHGDAFKLDETLAEYFEDKPRFAAIVSSLPLLNFPKDARQRLLRLALDHVVDQGPLIQFSYGFNPPIEPVDGVSMEKTGWVIRNIPPARVYVYRDK